MGRSIHTLRSLAEQPLFQLLLVVAAGIIAYANTFAVPFVFDDTANIVNNPLLRDLRNFVTPATLVSNRYLGYLSFALNLALHGDQVWGFHLVNLLIHLGSAVLVYLLLRLTLRTPFFVNPEREPLPSRFATVAPLCAALLFVAHPLQTQAVTYIVQRFTALATCLYLLAVVAYAQNCLRAEAEGWSGRLWYLVALAATLGAMKSKEIAFTLPFLLILYEALFLTGDWPRRLWRLAPFLLCLSVIPWGILSVSPSLGTQLGEAASASGQVLLSRGDYLLTELRVVVTYLRLLFWPVDQQVDYAYPPSHTFGAREFAAFALLLTLAGTAIWLLRRSRRPGQGGWRLVAFGLFWFFLALSVESSLIPIVDVIFEHRLYLPSVGIALALPLALLQCWRGPGPLWVLAGVVFVLLTATTLRNRFWQDEVGLWLDNARKSPDKARIYGNLGNAWKKRGADLQAVAAFDRFIALAPDNAGAYNNRGSSRSRLGNDAAALDDFNAALRLNPELASAWLNRGSLFYEQGAYGQALSDFQRAVALDPDFAMAYNNLGNAYDSLGQVEAAVAAYGQALRLDPDLAEAYYNRALVYQGQGREAEARADFARATQLGFAPRKSVFR